MTSAGYAAAFQTRAAATAYEDVVYAAGTQDATLWRLERERLIALLDRLPKPAFEMTHLDFACGTGRVLSAVEPFTRISTGIDISESMLEIASRKVLRSELRHGDVLRNPSIADAEYDLITAFRFFLNTEPEMRAAVMAALAARLRDADSRLVFSIQGNRHSVRHLGLARHARRGMRHNEMSVVDVRRLVHGAGLEIESWYGFGLLPAMSYRVPGLRLAAIIDRVAARMLLLRRLSVSLLFVCRPASPGADGHIARRSTSAGERRDAPWSLFFPAHLPVRALPTWSRPRLFVAARTRQDRWRASRLYPASRTRARIARGIFRASTAFGLGRVRRSPGDDYALAALLEDIIPDVERIAVLAGRSRKEGRAAKLTAELRGASGRRVFVKFAESEEAIVRLRREMRLLEQLPDGAGPRMLRYAIVGSGEALVTEAIEGDPLAARLDALDRIESWLSRLESARRRYAVSAHPGARALDTGSPVVAALLAVLDDREWPATILHGDCAPWNLIAGATGEIRAVDWENGELDGFPHLDRAFFLLQISALIHRRSPEHAVEIAARHLSRSPSHGLDRQQASAILGLVAANVLRQAVSARISTAGGHWLWWKQVLRRVSR